MVNIQYNIPMKYYRIIHLKPMVGLGSIEMAEIKANEFEDRTKEIAWYEKYRKRMSKAPGSLAIRW